MTTPPMTGGLEAAGSWIPMTPEAFSLLADEVDRLVATVGDSQSTAWADGISGDPDAPTFVANGELHVQMQRLEKLRSALANAHVVRPDGQIIVGSRVIINDADGFLESYVVVAPGQADARVGRISPESPLGAALFGRRAGDEVHVATAVGAYRVTVERVEYLRLPASQVR